MWSTSARWISPILAVSVLLSGVVASRGAAQERDHARADNPRRSVLIVRRALTSDATSRVLLDVRISDDLHTGLMGRVTSDGSTYLPLLRVLTFVGVQSRVAGATLSAASDNNRPGFRVDALAHTLRIGGSDTPLSPSDVLNDGPTLYASMPLLERLLLVSFDVDLATATVQIRSAEALPVLRRHAAQSAAALSSGLTSFFETVPTLRTRAHGMLQADYNLRLGRATQPQLRAVTSGAANSLLLSARFAARTLGGAVTGSVTTGRAAPAFSDVRWTHVSPNKSLIKRLVIGELDSRAAFSGRNGRLMRHPRVWRGGRLELVATRGAAGRGRGVAGSAAAPCDSGASSTPSREPRRASQD